LTKTHKGIQGHALIIAGSGKIGAAVLASKGCLKLAAAW
jgi:NAD(P)H-hydrate repair Nnr-like enzyme with NAD(P)H-hydrate dehydratase domain